MKQIILETYYRLLARTTTETHRYLFDTFNMSRQLVGIVGARGTGKTTMLLQYIKEKITDPDKALYFSADHIYFSENSLFEFVAEQYELEGRTHFCIDEVHKYPNWNQELKNMYDSFPDVHVAFSGSSSIDLITGSYDLSRRGVLYRLKGLSFREFLLFEKGLELPVYTMNDLMEKHLEMSREFADIPTLRALFNEYLQCGYYPFYFEDKEFFSQRLLSLIEKSIYEDIASFFNLKTANLPVLKKILAFLATIQPGEVSLNTMAKSLRVDHKTVSGYIDVLQSAGLLFKVGVNKSGAAMVRKPEKIFLQNSNLYAALQKELGHEGRIGTIRESFFLSMIDGAGLNPFYDTIGDYSVGETIFEIGGRNKDFKQVKDAGFLVKDDILIGAGKREIPLYLFGFLY